MCGSRRFIIDLRVNRSMCRLTWQQCLAGRVNAVADGDACLEQLQQERNEECLILQQLLGSQFQSTSTQYTILLPAAHPPTAPESAPLSPSASSSLGGGPAALILHLPPACQYPHQPPLVLLHAPDQPVAVAQSTVATLQDFAVSTHRN